MAIVITKQPTNVAANVNDTVSITLVATGDGLVYDWQYSTNGTKFYSLSASASASNWTHDQPTLTFRAYSGYLKYYFRCKITDSNGDSVFSDIVRVINLAEAGAGFILPETMHSLADAIRAKTETSAKMLPAEMAAMIEGLGGSFETVTGSFTLTNGLGGPVSLGTTLPEADNYFFLVAVSDRVTLKNSTTYYLLCGAIVCVDGTVTRPSVWSFYSSSKYTAALNWESLSLSGNNTLTWNSEGRFEGYLFSGAKYDWWYVYV